VSKRFILGLLGVLICVAAFLLYLTNKPQSAPKPQSAVLMGNTVLTADNIQQTVQATDGLQYYFFYKDDSDFQYINEYVIEPLLEELDADSLPAIQYVDFSNYQGSLNQLKNTWSISHIPSFLIVESNNGQITVISTLEYISEDPYDKDTLKTWMHENNIWTGKYVEQQPDNGETPVSIGEPGIGDEDQIPLDE